ncbi:efflux RND transporter permease subunit [Moritella viscosa]|uniref:RND family efflux transporter n=1 Tax=Moritella viscosa TaxID=80854 RepID=A0ABY1HG99_9GAMM|nr:efflux RND transporter permease subunit [Moritella viscosa]SGY96980.1 RND family efflux transporter [Moritella viscosa]SGZ09914.1 RND family efflux transporter [Moritella viscosa]SHO27391.1 RND family efflux transporter [Moritella viscosa]
MKVMIAWFAHNRVAANLIMMVIVAFGCLALPETRKELIPGVSLERIAISTLYPGAGPRDVEAMVCTRIEAVVYDIEGTLDLTSFASSGSCYTTIDIADDYSTKAVLDEVKSRIESINSFPDEVEKPVVSELIERYRVAKLIIAGAGDEWALKRLAENIRLDLLEEPVISVIELQNTRPYEISIALYEDSLAQYNLKFADVVNILKATAIDLPGGSLATEQGDILIQTLGLIESADDFSSIILQADKDGGRVLLSDIATITDGFRDEGTMAQLDGKRAVSLDVYRVGEQNILDVADAINKYVQAPATYLPEGVSLYVWQDDSKLFMSRIDLLVSNVFSGLCLLFAILLLFLNWRLSFWVSLGIPISFMGAFWLLPVFDASINIISLFAFLLVLGIVVDDAIVVGESIYTEQAAGNKGVEGAIEGAHKVAKPIIFAIITSVIAFMPLLFLPGPEGKLMQVIPVVVITTLLFSLFESLFILPAHLSHQPVDSDSNQHFNTKKLTNLHASNNKALISKIKTIGGILEGIQTQFSTALEMFVIHRYKPFLDHVLVWRWSYILGFVGLFFISLTLLSSGWLRTVLFSAIEGDVAYANVTFAEGSNPDKTKHAILKIEQEALLLQQELTDESGASAIAHVYSVVAPISKYSREAQAAADDHIGRVYLELSVSNDRVMSGHDIIRRWRERVGEIEDSIELNFVSDLTPPSADINIELSSRNLDDLALQAENLKQVLARFEGVYDIQDSQQRSSRQVQLALKPMARDMGLTLSALGQQVQQAYLGVEVQSMPRGEDEVKVQVSYPKEATSSLWHLENMYIQLPNGEGVPLFTIADVSYKSADNNIKRYERNRVISVSAFVDTGKNSTKAVIADLEIGFLQQLAEITAVKWSKAGKQKSIVEFVDILTSSYLLALIAMYLVMAILFSSYTQPLLVMFAIPFGLVGSLLGHLLLGVDVTLWSFIGMVAVSGIVVNDNLVLIDYINEKRSQGEDLETAITSAGIRRFRPIILTSLTTFIGLVPIMSETSLQAQFLIPMAISLAFGVLFATLVSLLLVPAVYLLIQDVVNAVTILLLKKQNAEAEVLDDHQDMASHNNRATDSAA